MKFIVNQIDFQPTGNRPDQDDFRVFIYDAADRILSNPILQAKAADPQQPFGQAIRKSFERQSDAIRLYLKSGKFNPIKIAVYQDMLNAIESAISSNFSTPALEALKKAYSVRTATIDMSNAIPDNTNDESDMDLIDPTSDVINVINPPPFIDQMNTPPSRDKFKTQQFNIQQQQQVKQTNTANDQGQLEQASSSKENDQVSSSRGGEQPRNNEVNSGNRQGSSSRGSENSVQQQNAASNVGASNGGNHYQGGGSSGTNQNASSQSNSPSSDHQSSSSSGSYSFDEFEKAIADARQYENDIVDGETGAILKKESEVLVPKEQGQAQQNQQDSDLNVSSSASSNGSLEDDLIRKNQEIINRAKEKLTSIERVLMKKVIESIASVTNEKVNVDQKVNEACAKGNTPYSLDLSLSVQRKNLAVSFNKAAKLLKEEFNTPDSFIPDHSEIDSDSLVLSAIGKGRPVLGEFYPITKKGYISIVLDTSGSMTDNLSAFSSHMLSLISSIKNNSIRYVIYHCDAEVSRIDVMQRKDAIKFFSKGTWLVNGGGGTNMTNGIVKAILDTENLTKNYGSMCALLVYTDCIDNPLDPQLIREAERNVKFNIREIPFIIVTSNQFVRHAEIFCHSVNDLGCIVSYIESRSIKISRHQDASIGLG